MGASRRIKVGIFFNARSNQGGLYQYALTLVDCLWRFVPDFDYCLYHATLEEFPLKLPAENWKTVNLPPRSIQVRLLEEAFLLSAARFGINIPFPVVTEFQEIRRDFPDVMLYVKPGVHPFQWRYKAVFPIHDLQHRLQPEFPEVSKNGEYRRREYFYRKSVRKASAILTDSQTGKEDVMNCYDVQAEKIFSVPYIAPTFRDGDGQAGNWVDLRTKYSLPSEYLFYPAAFWKHKNHERLIKAIALLALEKKVRIPLVLAGSKRTEYANLESLVNALDLKGIVHFIGYVPEEDMPGLYEHALALTMPTFFGPTNIPILEAWVTGCPVITSNLRGIREQVGDAGLLVDPKSDRSIADAILSIYRSPELRRDLIQRGERRAKEWTPQKFAEKLAEAIRYAGMHPLRG